MFFMKWILVAAPHNQCLKFQVLVYSEKSKELWKESTAGRLRVLAGINRHEACSPCPKPIEPEQLHGHKARIHARTGLSHCKSAGRFAQKAKEAPTPADWLPGSKRWV